MTGNNTNDQNDTIQCHDRIDLLNMIDQLEKDGYKCTVYRKGSPLCGEFGTREAMESE